MALKTWWDPEKPNKARTGLMEGVPIPGGQNDINRGPGERNLNVTQDNLIWIEHRVQTGKMCLTSRVQSN